MKTQKSLSCHHLVIQKCHQKPGNVAFFGDQLSSAMPLLETLISHSAGEFDVYMYVARCVELCNLITVNYDHCMDHTCIKSSVSLLVYKFYRYRHRPSESADPSSHQRFEVPTKDVKRAELVRLSWQTSHNHCIRYAKLHSEGWGKVCC